MKKIPLYLFITVFVYLITYMSSSLLTKYLAFSYLVYPVLIAVLSVCAYLVIMIYRQKECFSFNKVVFISIVTTFFALTTSNIIDSTHDIEKVFRSEVLSLNDKLPIMIDKNTRFDKVYFKGNDICYQYTLMNVTAKNVNRDFITLAISDKIFHTNQIDQMMLKLSKKKRTLNYIYHDRNKNFLTKVEIKNK